MASFLSFSQRMAANATKQEDANEDPWNLGVSTSTSTAETNEDARFSKVPPRTPEGLRPRKSIQRIRRDILGSQHYAHETKLSYNLPPDNVAANSHSALPPIHRPFSSFRQENMGILPSSLQRIDGSPIRSASSFYEQSIEESNNNNNNNYDEDINSSMEESSIYSRIQAESPDLKRGARPKTAVGAVLVAMAETSEPKLSQNRFTTTTGHQHSSILPPRSWMSNKRDDKYLIHESSDDMINTNHDMNYGRDDDDDNQSSLHASPSSLRRGVFSSTWNEEQRFQSDASFTRRILNDDPSSSRLEERSIVDHSPYDFNPIMDDDIHRRERINAPRVLSLKENNKLNISAISNSHHQKDFESINTSLADTIEDEEEEYKEIPRYYQALADDAPAHNIISDDAFLMKKVENQRLDKEDLLRSTFERFQDCLDLLKDVYSQGAIENSFFLGLSQKTGNEYCMRLQALVSEVQDGTQRRALLFCLSILKNSVSNTATDLNYLSNTRWVPRPGFCSSLGLNEEPLSPQTIRGGDTSLFSLPSESANADTPHTSNVSLATTITTVVSPGRYRSSIHNRFASNDQNIQGTRKTVTSLARLLYRLEETCRGLKSKIGRKSMLVESIQKIYFELLNVSSADLKVIISSFDMEYAEPQTLARAVSNDEVGASRSLRSSKQNQQIFLQEHAISKDPMRVNIVESDNDDIDSDHRNQSIECDLWSPTSEDMMSLVSPRSEAENNEPVTSNGYAELKDEQPFDDLRRTVGSFDEREEEEQREGPPEERTPLEEREPNQESFPATFARRVVGQRPRKSRFWKKRFLALKNRGRQVTAE